MIRIRNFDFRTGSCLIVSIVLGLVGCAPASSPRAAEPDDADLIGIWYAEPEFNDQAGHVAIHIAAGEEGNLAASISLLDIEAHELPIGPVNRSDERLQVGILSLQYDADGPTLTGLFPSAFVPVHTIEASFRKVDSIPALTVASATSATTVPHTEPAWVFPTDGPVWAGVAFADSMVFAGSDDGNIYAIDPSTGAQEWRFATQSTIRARPVAASDSLLVQSDDGYLYSLSLTDGSQQWRALLQETPRPRLGSGDKGFRYDHLASSAAAYDGKIFVGSLDGHLYALDEATGEELWRFKTDDIVVSTPTARNGKVFVGSFDGHVYALDTSSGEVLWRHDTGAEVSSSPTPSGDVVIVGSRSYDLVALDTADGLPVWSYYYWFSWVESSALVRDGTVYIGSSDAQRLYSLDAATGELRWRFDGGGSLWAQPAATGDTIYIGAVGVGEYITDHQAAFWAVDRDTGDAVWRFRMERPAGAKMWGFASSPAVGADRVYVGSLDANIYAFDQ